MHNCLNMIKIFPSFLFRVCLLSNASFIRRVSTLFFEVTFVFPPLKQERLEKEKKLSGDLGQAATKLQQLLKATQEQLTKERETMRTLQEHLEVKVGPPIRGETTRWSSSGLISPFCPNLFSRESTWS